MADKDNFCHVCDDSGAGKVAPKFVCIDCRSRMCEKCKVKHNQNDIFNGHVVKSLAPAPPIMELAVMCRNHKDRPAPYWCIQCNVALCSNCTIASHSNHKTEQVKASLKDSLSKLPREENNISETGEELSYNLTAISEKLKFMNADFKQVKQEIDTHFENTISSIMSRKEELLYKLHQTHESQTQNLENDLDMERRNIQKVQEWKQKRRTALTTSVSESSFNSIKDLIADGQRVANIQPVVSQGLTCFEFKAEKSLNMGKLAQKDIFIGTTPIWKEQLSGPYTQQIKFISSETLGILRQQSLTYYAWEKVESKFVRQRETKFPGHSLLDFAVVRGSGNLYMTCSTCTDDDDNAIKGCGTVHQYDIKGNQFVENKQQWPRGKFNRPVGLAVNMEGDITVTDCGESTKYIYILKPNGSIVHKISGRSTGEATALACLKLLGLIAADTEAERQLVMSAIDDKGKGPLLRSPFYIAWDKNEHLIVSDRAASCLYIFDSTGEVRHKLGSPGVEDHSPEGVCTDNHGHIFFALNGKVYVLAIKGGEIKHQPIGDVTGQVSQLDFIKQRGRGLLAVRTKQNQTMHVQLFSAVYLD